MCRSRPRPAADRCAPNRQAPRHGTPDWPFLAPSQTLLDFQDPNKGETQQQREYRGWGNIREGETIAFPAIAEGEALEDYFSETLNAAASVCSITYQALHMASKPDESGAPQWQRAVREMGVGTICEARKVILLAFRREWRSGCRAESREWIRWPSRPSRCESS